MFIYLGTVYYLAGCSSEKPNNVVAIKEQTAEITKVATAR